MKKLGFIGAGVMGGTIAKSVAKSLKNLDIMIYDIDSKKTKELCVEIGASVTNSSSELVSSCDVIILAVKPQYAEISLNEFKEVFTDDKLLISIIVGLPTTYFTNILGNTKRVIRTMPNTPALVGEGMTIISRGINTTDSDVEIAQELFLSCGMVELLEEKFMNEVTALTGSSPAYIYILIEAMSDAAVLSGIPRNISYKLAAQAVLGSAKMVLESGKHPGELKDQVCSPGGTTIEAVASLEQDGFRNAIIQAMNKCTDKARGFSNK